MCMNKNQLINDVVANLVAVLNSEQLDIVKATLVIKMQGYDIHEVNTLPSAEVKDNDFILKRFTVDMLAKGLKKSSIRTYMNNIKPFFEMTGLCYLDVTAQAIIDYLAVKKIKQNRNGKQNSQSYIATISRTFFIFFNGHTGSDILKKISCVTLTGSAQNRRKKTVSRRKKWKLAANV